MNICFIGPQVIKTVSGGAWTQVINTAETLKEYNHNVTFFDYWQEYNWKNFDIVHLFKAEFGTFNIAKWLYESDVPFIVSPIFFNTHNVLSINFALFISKIFQKLITGMRTDFDYVREVCNYSQKVLPNTHAEGNLLQKGMNIPKQKIIIIPNGVEKRFANADPSLFSKKYGINDFILSAGDFGNKRKNMLNLIYALEKIDHPAVLIGTIYNNAYGNRCRERMKKSKNILWLNAVDHDDPMLASAYAASKVFVLPSYFETPGLTALEAGLAGANIVITPHGGTREYFGTMAEYVNPMDISSIKNCITTALDKKPNPELKKHIFNTYAYPTIVEKLITCYQEIISR